MTRARNLRLSKNLRNPLFFEGYYTYSDSVVLMWLLR